MTRATMNTRSVTLNPVTSSDTTYNTNYAICSSRQATSSEVKCSLPSSLKNFKSISQVTLTLSPSPTSTISEINLFIDHDYAVGASHLPKNHGKMIHLEAAAHWLYSSTINTGHDLVSIKIPSSNSIEAVIPASSCFNLTLRESITMITIPFTASGTLVSEETGSIVGGTVSLSGHITANIIDTDYSEVLPCT